MERLRSALAHAGRPIAWPLTCRGFFSEYNVLLWMLLHARVRGREFVLEIDGDSIISRALAERLLNVPTIDATRGAGGSPWSSERVRQYVPGTPEFLFRRLWRQKRERSLGRRVRLLDALYALHQEVWNGAALSRPGLRAAFARLGLHEDERYVAMHIRRGDKLVTEARYVGAEVFASRIPPEMASLPIVVATDDHGAFLELRDYLAASGRGNRLTTTASDRDSGHDESAFRARSVAEREAAIGKVLVDFELMCRSAHFVGSFTSNMSRAVHVARRGHASCSVDTEFRFIQ